MSLKTTASASTHPGQRDKNEDALLTDDELGLYIVCDGLGGHAAGEVASRRATEIIDRHVRVHGTRFVEPDDTQENRFELQVLLSNAVLAACRELHKLAQNEPSMRGMATTVTAVLVRGSVAVLAHVGDTRLYLQRGEEVQILTTDHTMAHEMVSSGRMTAEEAEHSELGHVLTRTVGSQPSVIVDTLSLHVLPGDTYLLCSDGLHHYFRDSSELRDPLRADDLSQTSSQLVDQANARGGHDNISAVVMRVGSTDHAGTRRRSDRVRRRLEILSQAPPFAGFALRRLNPILAGMSIQRFAEATDLFQPGDPLGGLYVVVHGALHCESRGELQPGACVGESALTRERAAPAGVRVAANTELLFLSRDAFNELIDAHARLGTRLLWNLLDQAHSGRP